MAGELTVKQLWLPKTSTAWRSLHTCLARSLIKESGYVFARSPGLSDRKSPIHCKQSIQLRHFRTHRRGLSTKYSPPQPQKPHESQNPYAQTPQNERYVDSARPLKRQRSDSDFADNASAYPPTQMPRTTYGGYAGSTLPQSYGQYKQEPQDRMHMSYNDHSSLGYNIRGANSYPPPGSSISGYQNPLQQPGPSPLSANTGLGNIGEHGPSSSASSVPRPLNNYYGSTGTAPNYGSYSGNYQAQTTHQYPSTSRTSSDSYPGLIGLQTPTSMTDIAALPSGHESNYMPSTSGAIGAATSAHTPVQSHHQAHDYSALSGGYTHTPATYVHSSPSYPTAPSQAQHAHHSSMEHVPYSSTLSDQSIPASNMLLGQAMPHNFYQQDEASYPTPTHAKQPPWG